MSEDDQPRYGHAGKRRPVHVSSAARRAQSKSARAKGTAKSHAAQGTHRAGTTSPHRTGTLASDSKISSTGRYTGSGSFRTSPSRSGVMPVVHSRSTWSGASHKKQDNRSALMVGLAAVVIVALVFVWWGNFRSVGVTVNGKPVNCRINSTVDDFITHNNNFDVKPGNLLSVSGKVLTKQGGNKYTVKINGKELTAKSSANRVVNEGDRLTVENGTDATEPHTIKREQVAPGVEEGTGGSVQFVSQWGEPGEKEVWTGKKSGETIDKGVTKQPKNLVIANIIPEPAGSEKYMALTFDDGPSEYTPKILDILKEKGVHATFFNLGNSANEYPQYTKRLLKEGNELASHTMRHQYLPKLDRNSLRSEITTAFDALKSAGGTSTQMIRAPYGAFTKTEWARSADLISCNVLWNIDTTDWKRPGADAIKSQVLDNAHNGYIALMHDGGGNREQDIEALPGIIDGLQQAGYKLVTVKELLKMDKRVPKEVYEGKVSLPKGSVLPSL